MKVKTSIIAATIALSTASYCAGVQVASASGRPTHIYGRGHTCSYTNPEALLEVGGMNAYMKPGTMKFTAYHIPREVRPWEDTYWVLAGWLDDPVSICDKRTVKGTGGAKGSSYTLGRIRGPILRVSIHATGIHSRLGFDVWVTSKRGLHTPTEMEENPNTWEIMVEPGKLGHIYSQGFVGWHRVYIGGGGRNPDLYSVHNLNLDNLIRKLHIPGWYYWNGIDAGGETARGHFSVQSASINIQGSHPKLRWKVQGHPIVSPGRPPVKHKKPEHHRCNLPRGGCPVVQR